MQPTASHVLDLSTGPIMVADSFRGKKSNNRKTVKTRKVPQDIPSNKIVFRAAQN